MDHAPPDLQRIACDADFTGRTMRAYNGCCAPAHGPAAANTGCRAMDVELECGDEDGGRRRRRLEALRRGGDAATRVVTQDRPSRGRGR